MVSMKRPTNDGEKDPKKVVCQRTRTERYEVDQRIAGLVQCLLDDGMELCGANIRSDNVELGFYDAEGLNQFYDLAVPIDAESASSLYQRAIDEHEPDDANWWTDVLIVPPDPSAGVDSFSSVFTLVFPLSDYDEVLGNVRENCSWEA